MMKTIFATIGLLAIIILIGVWQYGFFSSSVDKALTKLDRATAVQRAESMIQQTKQKAEKLTERSRTMKIEARTMEIGLEREREELAKTESAVKQLSVAIKTAGLPKPSEIANLTEDQKQTEVVFGGKTGTAMEAYNMLIKWNSEYKQKKAILDGKSQLVLAKNNVADQILDKQKEMYAAVEKIQLQLGQLATEKEIAAINKELTDLGGNVEGVNTGELGKVLDTIQEEIDELTASAEVVKTETDDKSSNNDTWSKEDAAPTVGPDNSLDELWD